MSLYDLLGFRSLTPSLVSSVAATCCCPVLLLGHRIGLHAGAAALWHETIFFLFMWLSSVI
jgi:hypothetical protein